MFAAIIPIRAGSKGFPGKNVRPLAGKPLFRHAVDQAIAAGASRVIITTDICEVIEAQFEECVEVLARPTPLCSDSAPMAPVILHALEANSVSGAVVLMQATSPLRRPSHVVEALEMFSADTFDLVMSVAPADRAVLKYGTLVGDRFVPLVDARYSFSNRQDLPSVVRPNGAVYVFNAEWFRSKGSFSAERIGVIHMSHEDSYDIDRVEDLIECERILKERAKEK